jgi:hypothetical protein
MHAYAWTALSAFALCATVNSVPVRAQSVEVAPAGYAGTIEVLTGNQPPCPETITISADPVLLSCERSFTIDQGNNAIWSVDNVALSSGRGGGAVEARAYTTFSATWNLIGGSSARSDVMIFFVVEPTLLGRLLPDDGIAHVLAVVVPWTATWNLSSSGFPAVASGWVRIAAGALSEQTFHYEQLCADGNEFSGCQEQMVGQEAGEGRVYSQVGRVSQVTYAAQVICRGNMGPQRERCEALVQATSEAPDLPDKRSVTGLRPRLPYLDPDWHPENYGLPSDARVEDYFSLRLSEGLDAESDPSLLFRSGFE